MAFDDVDLSFATLERSERQELVKVSDDPSNMAGRLSSSL